MFSHSSPQRVPTAGLGNKVRLAALPLVLVTAWLNAAGCAGPQAYLPFERKTKVAAATRWQALESVARREQWNVVAADPQDYTILAYSNPSGTLGVRDRIKVELLADRTVVETQSEIEDQGRWQASASRCAGYASTREKLLAAQIESRGEPAGSAGGAPSREAERSERGGVAGGGPKGMGTLPRFLFQGNQSAAASPVVPGKSTELAAAEPGRF